MKYAVAFSIALATGIGTPGPALAAATAVAQAPCRLFSGIDVARYLNGPATFSSAPDGSICLARRGTATILKAQVQNDRQVIATENQRRIAVPEICKMSGSLLCTVAQKSVSVKSAQQGFDVYTSVMRRSPTYRALSGIGDEAFEYSLDESDARGVTVVAMSRGSLVAVTLIGDDVSLQSALRQLPDVARGVIANIK